MTTYATISNEYYQAQIFHSPVDRFVVSFTRYYLGSQIVRCSAQSPSDVWNLFGKPEISDL